MSKKWSSYKEAQLITESWRQYLTEDDGSPNAAAVVKAAKTPEVQKLVAVAEQDPKVQAALDAVMDELASAGELEEAALPTPEESEQEEPYWSPDALETLVGQRGFVPTPEESEQKLSAIAGGTGALAWSVAAMAAIENTAAHAALLKALGGVLDVALMGTPTATTLGMGPLWLAMLGAAGAVLLIRRAQSKRNK